MVKNLGVRCLIFLLSFFYTCGIYSQNKTLTIKDAISIAINNYGTLKAKSSYINASQALVSQSQKEYLPDLNVSMQQDYGTVNGQNGILYGYRGLSASPSGPAMNSQNWNAAFGSLYLTNINWDFFAFGKAHEKVQVAKAAYAQDKADLLQEQFQHQVRVAAAYLNLLAAQRITLSQKKNLDRAKALATVVIARARNGLNPGVDSSQANAEVSNAKILLTRSIDNEQEQSNQLSILLGIASQDFILDTVFIKRIPAAIDTSIQFKEEDHPLLKYYRSRVDLSNARAKYYNTFKYPTFSAFGVIQGRGSGFNYNYNSSNMDGYTKSYTEGVKPTRANYLVGVGLIWNLSGYLKVNQQVQSQKFTSKGLSEEYEVVDQRIKNEMILAGTKIKNALQNFYEVPVEIKAASDAYLQKSVLYKNGLASIIDVTQALYALNRAETDRDIAYNNVWQALLYKAAASGDFNIFIKEF
ncbi:TolC family protein [Segetibacter koreensis]|uniref:TolC family protein n=1 Tax=Segetibacter koreensis TaxID=398037 RepID=UPI00036755C9|nr:TolC family protein [Segetibacter koreensis]